MTVYISEQNFEYDIHSLVKAFFQHENIQLTYNAADAHEIGIAYTDNDVEVYGFATDGREIRYREATEGLERPEIKNTLKQLLYRMLCELSGHGLPWGTLTGIRPTKIPMKLLLEGANDEEIRRYMKDTYFASDEKIDLATSIARLEENIISEMSGINGYSLYIGIPFCPTTCLYCSFTSYPITLYKDLVDKYLEALEKELAEVAELFKDKILDTVYIGGGTPTTLLPHQFERLIGFLRVHFDFSSVKEFTVEAGRPDSITLEKLETLERLGVNRISINPQTMNADTLKIIGRNHTPDQIVKAFKMAREIGFKNINMDIILGLPGEKEAEVESTLKKIEKLMPDSLTVHSMAIKRAAGMARYLEEHQDIESVNTPAMMQMTFDSATRMGMAPYYLYRQKNMSGNFENVGYSKPGKYGIYNILIMEEVQTIVACGAGTVTKRVYGDGRIERCDNVKDVNLYISKIEEMIDRKRELFKI